MTIADLNLLPALPEMFLLVAASLVLMLDLFVSDAKRHVTLVLALAALAGCVLLLVAGDSAAPSYSFHRMFVADAMSQALKVMSCLAAAAVLVYSRGYVKSRDLYRGEFYSLALFATLGMMVMISANSLLTLYLGLELMGLSLYAMVALRRDSVQASEAAMKYFILGALASGLLLYGMSMIYGATGTLEITQIARRASGGMVLVFGLVFLVSGLAFKLGAVPFHMWVPDVYQGAPTAVTMFIGSAPKLAGFAIAIRLLAQAMGAPALLVEWQSMLMILAVLSLAVGNVTAIAQTNLKRMLAYSTISHTGFLLLGVLCGSQQGYSMAMFYIVVYVVMSLAAFAAIVYLAREGFEAEELDDFRGLNQRNPWAAFLMLMVMFSLAGIPPLLGFWAKLFVLQVLVKAGFLWLAVVAVMFSLVGAFYYLRIVKLMYMDAPADRAPIEAGADVRALLTVNALALLVLGLAPQWLVALCERAIRASLSL